MQKRRQFLRLSGYLTFCTTVLPDLVKAANPHLNFDQQPVKAGNQDEDPVTVLFQGDSITDAGRDRGNYYPNSASGMGSGYVHHIVTDLLGKYPARNYQFYNRGISGDKVFQLANRWKDDCLNLKPDILSILVGVNDFWHTLSFNYPGTAAIYERDYRSLLERTQSVLPAVKLIIGEPFAVRGGTAINEKWKEYDEYRSAAKRIAEDFGAVFIPYHQVFEKALQLAPASYWCPDGVHPSLAGCYLMKEAWLSAF